MKDMVTSDAHTLSVPEVELILDLIDDARVMHDPQVLVQQGVPQWIAYEAVETYESDFSDPKRTIWGPDGRPVARMRAVLGLDLIERVAKVVMGDKFKSPSSWGWQNMMFELKDGIRKRLGLTDPVPKIWRKRK